MAFLTASTSATARSSMAQWSGQSPRRGTGGVHLPPAHRKQDEGKRLLSTEDKHALIASLGVEHYLCPDFEEIKAMTPEQFVLGIIRDCNARALFCGENFTFGARAAGTPELLRQLCAPLGVEVVVLPMAQFEEKPVSSTRIRTALEGGDIPAPMPCWGCPTPSASRCITGRALAGRWGCRPSTSSIRRASSCPGTASISPAPG
mgnify:CR=1 FL=1